MRHPLTAFGPRLGESIPAPAARPVHRQRMPLSNGTGRDLEQVVKLGRGAFHLQVPAMQSRMILVQPAEQGWSVTFRGLPLSNLPTRSQAVESATGHAGDRFAITGEPIGVVLRLACGSEVLIVQHGLSQA